MATQTASTSNQAARFGTFAGVFTPNILTILGIILFLRLGWVVGQAGLWGALAIVILANAISFLTGLSLSAIATNMRIRAGGNYYLISRSLGLEIGGAIGIPLFLSQAISVAFYIIGFTEALRTVEQFADVNPQIVATGVAFVFVVIAYVGADFALKIQYVILAIVMAALASFFAGTVGNFGDPHLSANYEPDISFWLVFAVFFPAVTGIEVGTSLSGDLKDPGKSIPQGTLASILFTAAIYISVVVLFAFTASPETLINDALAMEGIALVPILILFGVWASTLSSALGSVLAAPRTLQAIASDSVVPKWMSAQLGSRTEPRVAVIITGIIAVIVIWAGDLDVVAPIITMFFLNTYGMVNVAAAIEGVVRNPSYRPRFRTPWYVSLLGALGCYGAMILINLPATLIAVVVSYGVFIWLQRRRLETEFGDIQRGLWYALSRYALLKLEHEEWHPKNWRPNLIVFTGQPHNREHLVNLTRWMVQSRGIVTFFQILVGNVSEPNMQEMRKMARKHIHQYIEEHRIPAFAEAEIAPNFRDGALLLAQAHGIGGIEANAILMGWSRDPGGRVRQMLLLRDFIALQKSALFLHMHPERLFGKQQRIQVWWKGRGGNEDLMLLLAHLISIHPEWRGADVHLMRIVDNEEALKSTTDHLTHVLEDVQVRATPVCLVRESPDMRLADMIAEVSHNADLTILGMPLPTEETAEDLAERLNKLAEKIGTVLLVRNAEGDADLLTLE